MEDKKLEEAAKESYNNYEYVSLDKTPYIDGFKAGVSWKEKQMRQGIEDILHHFTGTIQVSRATGKMKRVMSSNEWAQYVIDYMKNHVKELPVKG